MTRSERAAAQQRIRDSALTALHVATDRNVSDGVREPVSAERVAATMVQGASVEFIELLAYDAALSAARLVAPSEERLRTGQR